MVTIGALVVAVAAYDMGLYLGWLLCSKFRKLFPHLSHRCEMLYSISGLFSACLFLAFQSTLASVLSRFYSEDDVTTDWVKGLNRFWSMCFYLKSNI